MATSPLAFVSIARAEPSAADLDTARDLYKAGLELRKGGDEAGAAQKFKAAYSLSKSPVIGVDLGKSEIAIGELVEAREQLLDVDALPVSAKEGKASVDARAEASKLAAELKPRIPTLTILVTSAASGAGTGAGAASAKLTIDGASIPPEAAGQPRAINPGSHVIGISNGGPEVTTNVTLTEGEARSITIAAPTPGGAQVTTTTTATAMPTVTPTPLPPPNESPTPSGSRTSPLVFVGFGIAGVGLVAGTVTGILALSKASSLKNDCPHSVCPPAHSDELDSAKTISLVSTIGFAVAGAGVLLGIVGLATGKKGEQPAATTAHVEPFFGLGAVGVQGAF